MARSALIVSLQRAYKIARASLKTGIPTDEIVDILKQRTTRRRLLYGGLGLASALATATWHNGRDSTAFATIPKVLVVGAGIAGLTAAYRLRQAGVPVDIIEARNRVGGRIRSLANAAGTDITVELGGEFIDTDHSKLRSLAQELGLTIVDLLATDKGLVPETWYFQGRKIAEVEIINYFIPLAQKIEEDLVAIGDGDVTYRSYNQATFALDNTSIAEYLDQAKINPILQEMLYVAYTIEYGREAAEQSCLNLVFLIGTNTDTFSVYGESDERYTIRGGNDQVPRLLADYLANVIQTDTELEAICIRPDGRYRVSLRSGYRTFDRTYERILLTLPFSTLRLVKLKVNLPAIKQKAIAELGYGTNAKLITAYQQKLWRTKYNSTAATFTDTGFQNTWEPSRYQKGPKGLITNFTAGEHGLSLGKGSAESQAEILLPQLDRIFPGIKNLRQGQAIRAYWPGEQYTRASYACYLVGQWTGISGAEQKRVGNLFFAGEHCSPSYQGYMEGGCRTGEVAARRILKDLGWRNISAEQKKPITTNRLNRYHPRIPRDKRFSDDYTQE
ncbi:flavin monoamine oxidase family protein [Nostoc favosum]|uniref:FAD-dependent oxidoreductase n=1 Tax=Nostoc favosum CHAB5714 TaxID=2780399 RepID=A0ABS8I1X2_9NOSO|nr:NAD(P)/FAD-dependent oxidoreductase [Nostoc favosum]MCC5598205.1 FAD-dependent oxidoreductase [Nostoc favosum CHAB5714]